MSIVTDILVRSATGRPIAVVEVKNPQDLSLPVATTIRRDMISHGLLADVPYFLLVSQDQGYLWMGSQTENTDDYPPITLPMRSVVKRYLPVADSNDRLRGSELELVVIQWLRDLAESRDKLDDEPERLLASSGFLDAIRRAAVIPEFHV